MTLGNLRGKKRETKASPTRKAVRMQTTRQDVNNLRRRRSRRVIKPASSWRPRRSPFRPIQLPFGHPRFAATFVYTCTAEARLTARAIELEGRLGGNSRSLEKIRWND